MFASRHENTHEEAWDRGTERSNCRRVDRRQVSETLPFCYRKISPDTKGNSSRTNSPDLRLNVLTTKEGDGMSKTFNASEERVEGKDGLRIFVRSWRPERNIQGVITIVPGFNSHSGYYRWAGEELAKGGLAVYALDLRGRGLS